MVYAFNPNDPTVHFHEGNFGFFSISLDSTTGSCTLTKRA